MNTELCCNSTEVFPGEFSQPPGLTLFSGIEKVMTSEPSAVIHHQYDFAAHFHVCGLFCPLFVPLLIVITHTAAFYGVLQASKALLIVTFSCASEAPAFLTCLHTVGSSANPHLSSSPSGTTHCCPHSFHPRIPSDSLRYFSQPIEMCPSRLSLLLSGASDSCVCCHGTEVFMRGDI